MYCIDCGYNCYEKCLFYVFKNCIKLKLVLDFFNSSVNVFRLLDIFIFKSKI